MNNLGTVVTDMLEFRIESTEVRMKEQTFWPEVKLSVLRLFITAYILSDNPINSGQTRTELLAKHRIIGIS